MTIRVYSLVPGEHGPTRGLLVGQGSLEDMSLLPPLVRQYLLTLKAEHADVESYLRQKCPPMAMLARGYLLEVEDDLG